MWLVLFAVLLSTDVCAARERRCIETCNSRHTIGSFEHLECKHRCWEEKLICTQEEN